MLKNVHLSCKGLKDISVDAELKVMDRQDVYQDCKVYDFRGMDLVSGWCQNYNSDYHPCVKDFADTIWKLNAYLGKAEKAISSEIHNRRILTHG
jgi:hypothetical protein